MNGRKQMLIAALLAALVTVAFFMLVLRPKFDEIADTRTQVETAEQEEASLRGQIARLQELRQQGPALIARLRAISAALPSTPELPNFIRLAQTAARQASVDLRSIAPSPPTPVANATGIQQINVTLTVEGGYFRLEDFFARLENMPRIVVATAVSLSPSATAAGGGTTLVSTITLKMFVVEANARVGGSTSGAPTPEASP